MLSCGAAYFTRMDGNGDIDDSLYSRQRYVLGDGAMQKLSKSNVLIIGLGGIGVEVAKNVILAGVKSVALYDNKVATTYDLGTQFFLRQRDVDQKIPRAIACAKRLAELNPYVAVSCIQEDIFSDYQLLKEYQCVFVSELKLGEQIGINNFCRSQIPSISFISCDVIGVFSYLFCDFGSNFKVLDSDGEELRDIFIHSISKGNSSIIKTLENKRHELESGDTVLFKELSGGWTVLNGLSYKIRYIDPYSFSIDFDSTCNDFELDNHGGTCIKVKEPVYVNFQSLASQIKMPDIVINDLAKSDAPMQAFIGILSLEQFSKEHLNCKLVDNMNLFISIAENISLEMGFKLGEVNKDLLRTLALTSFGILAPLCAAIGGIGAQEVLKAISGKFYPLKQWLLLDAVELGSPIDIHVSKNSRYGMLNACLNSDLVNRLKSLKLFMVGCGAIGCEMLKNLSLLGVGSSHSGLITITDHDLIEKSNLNRQFLFRPWHIQKSKAITAAESSLEINPDTHILAHQDKVCPETQLHIFNDAFFEKQDLVLNALDNVEARRYVDSRCVSNRRPLLETGTMGPKGHVQVIVPHLTESYSNQRDPVEEDFPYCTLKSFPQIIEHTIQWARDKFESIFNLKPNNYNKFWEINPGPSVLCNVMVDNTKVPDGFVDAIKVLQNKPLHFEECVSIARTKFEMYFNHKAKQLLSAFPLDTKLADGGLFWQSPKRPPTPLMFDENDKIHMEFIISYAKILARINRIHISDMDLHKDNLSKIIRNIHVPQFVASNKKIDIYDAKKPDVTYQSDDKIEKLILFLKKQTIDTPDVLIPEHFEKDDDSNSHIDFITAASNLRARMYGIETVDRFKTKRIAGRIIPAIATTTAAIAGLASIELLKVVAKQPIQNLKNCFLNLALPMMVLSQPGATPKVKIRDDLEFSLWDRWEVHGNKDFKLKDFILYFLKEYSLTVNMVCNGVKMIYVPMMPGHKKRINFLMTTLLKPKQNDSYVDLVLSFELPDMNGDGDLPAPPVRYFYNCRN